MSKTETFKKSRYDRILLTATALFRIYADYDDSGILEEDFFLEV